MKKITRILLGIASFVILLNSCKIDNYEGPNASFEGVIKDVKTGELVGTDTENGSAIRAYELGFSTYTAQSWNIKNTGEFMNKLVFAADYDFEFVNCNFYPFKIEKYKIKGGVNKKDFEVTPYLRVLNPSITFDKAQNKVIAKFKLEPGKEEVRLSEIRLFAFTDIWVGNNVKFNLDGAEAVQKFSDAVVDNNEYTLSIDLTKNANFFKYSNTYFFRIGALASVSKVGTVRHNYAPLVSIKL